MQGKNVINGTFGEVWLDDEKLAEQKGLQAQISFNKEDVNIAGELAVHKKVISWEGTGTLRLHKVNSGVARKVNQMIKEGKEVTFTVISKLSDPDAAGAERIVIRNVLFDDLTMIDFEPATVLELEMPFTFDDYDYIDYID